MAARLLREKPGTGYDADRDRYVDMLEAGVIDPVKVTRLALECAASLTATLLAAEAGVPCLSLDPVAGGPADAPADYYEQVMRNNLRTLENALGNR